MRRSSDVGHSCRSLPAAVGQPLDQRIRVVALPAGPKIASRTRRHGRCGRFVDEALRFGVRLVGGDIGLRRRADVELQPPGALAADFAAPQFERADLGELRMQSHRHGAALAAAARLEHRANRRQGGHLLAIDGNQLARPIGQPDARDVERKLDRLRDEQVELPVGQFDCPAPARRCRARGRARHGRARARRRRSRRDSTPM